MSLDFQVVLDACVLVNAALRDTLLRLAEPPGSLYLPRWSTQIIEETRRTLENKLGLSANQTLHLIHELETYFGEAWVTGFEPLIPAMTNHPKDRHVLAATVLCGAQTIVTFNVKDFPADVLAPWNIEAQTPDRFLVHQFHLNPEAVLATLKDQAAQHGGWERLMTIHHQTVPDFASLLKQQCP